MDDVVPVQLQLEFPPDFGKIFDKFEANLNPRQLNNDHLQAAAKTVVQLMLQPNRTRARTYSKRFSRHIEHAHQEQPLVSRALLGRFALEEITLGHVWPSIVSLEEVDQVNSILSREHVVI